MLVRGTSTVSSVPKIEYEKSLAKPSFAHCIRLSSRAETSVTDSNVSYSWAEGNLFASTAKATRRKEKGRRPFYRTPPPSIYPNSGAEVEDNIHTPGASRLVAGVVLRTAEQERVDGILVVEHVARPQS